MNNPINCPNCNSDNTIIIYTEPNSFFTNLDIKFNLKLSRCKLCGFVFQSSAYCNKYDDLINDVYKN